MATVSSPVAAPTTGHPASPWTRDLVTAVLGLWTVLGLFVDGWAHMSLASTTESFFTPWHALLYSGFAAGATWIALPAVRSDGTWRERLAALPHGYGIGALGAVLFAFGGLADSTWHTVLGIETDLDALLSPPHLLLLTGGLLMLTTPIRATSARVPGTRASLRDLLPAVLGLLVVLAAVSFFLEYLWPDVAGRPSAEAGAFYRTEYPGDGFVVFLADATTLAGRYLGAIVMVGGISVLSSRWELPGGVVTLLLGGVTLLHFGLAGGPTDLAPVFAAPLLAALLTEVVVRRWRPRPGERLGIVVLGAVLPTLWFALHLGALALTRGGLDWEVGLVGGAVIVPALLGVGVALVATPMRPPTSVGASDRTH